MERFNIIHQQSGKRGLVIVDSIEEGSEDTITTGIKLTALTKNMVEILAGRPKPFVIDYFEILFPDVCGAAGYTVHKPIYLTKFTIPEVTEYFTKILATPPKQDLIETITILTDGKPVLLALTAEWFKHNIQLPAEINKSKAELEALPPLHLKQLQKQFERILVERVRAVREPLNQAILYMSYLDRRYDRRILQLAMEQLTPEEVVEMEPQLRQMAFIRSFLDDSSGLLHDEAKRLINQHAWPPHDPDGEERRVLAQKVIDQFYLPEIEKLRDAIANILKNNPQAPPESYQAEETLAHEFEMECLDYHFRISLEAGRRYTTQLIQQGLTLQKREGIYHEISRRVSKQEADIALARINLKRGLIKDNRETIEQALQQNNLSPWYTTTLLYELSDAPTDPEEKANYLNQALKIAQDNQDQKAVAQIHNDLGLMYRRQGLWDKAEQSYEQTLSLIKTQAIDDPNQKAATLNNLAFVKLLQGDLDLAQSLADIALGIRQEQGNQIGVAFSYLTRGQITATKGNREQALQDYQIAATLFEKTGRDQDHAQALIHLATIKRINQDFEAAEKLLAPALTTSPSETRAKAERELGALYRTQGDLAENPTQKSSHYQAATTAFQNSLKTSQQKRDWYGQAQALYDLIFMSYLNTGTLDKTYTPQLKEILTPRHYSIIEAELSELEADIIYNNGQILPAFKIYIEVAKILSTHHIRKYTLMFERFKRKFLAQPNAIQAQLCTDFDHIIATLSPESRLRSSLSSLCRAIKIAY